MPAAAAVSPSAHRPTKGGADKRLANAVEALSWLCCCSVYFTWYNPIGELAKARGINDSILQRIDDSLPYNLPYVPEMIFPYVAVYAMPVCYLLSLCTTHGLDIPRIRRFFITQMTLITVAFAIFYLFPVRTDTLFNPTTGKHNYGEETLAGRLCYKFVHQGISLWVGCPSMHTAHAFSIAAAFAADNLRGRKVAAVLAVATLFSTLMTGAHVPPHLAFGLLLAFAGHKAVFEPLTRHLTALSPSSVFAWTRFYVASAAPLVFIVVGEYLHRVSGWNTDIPAMFGFEANPVLGFYGFHP